MRNVSPKSKKLTRNSAANSASSPVALQLTPEEEAEAQRLAECVRGLAQRISVKASASEPELKVSDTDLEEVATKSRKEVAAVRKEVANVEKHMQATVSELNQSSSAISKRSRDNAPPASIPIMILH